jgi:chaperonin cofactor prefoldin
MKKILFLILTITISIFVFPSLSKASSIGSRLAGRILLQVENKGEAYYVSPSDLKKYYLGRPDDAFSIMRSFGLGVSNRDLNIFLENRARRDLSGKILLKVEDKGQAYYVNPVNLRLYYLGRPHDAFAVMRNLGLGISNNDLGGIELGFTEDSFYENPVGLVAGQGERVVKYSWRYKNKNYNIEKILKDDLYQRYKNADRFLRYTIENRPDNLRDSYYGIFLEVKDGDDFIDRLIRKLKKISDSEGFSDDEFLEFAMSFVQYIPYDFSKDENSPQSFPYETLYKNSGVCSDKSFLALLILRKMGYGGAIFDYPEAKHSAVAVACLEPSSYSSGYCFIETTNYFPVGVFPGGLSSGKAESSGNVNWQGVFSGGNLGRVEVLQETSGRLFGGMREVVERVNSIKKTQDSIERRKISIDSSLVELNNLKREIDSLLIEMNRYRSLNDTVNYNEAVSDYNSKASDYNQKLDTYHLSVDIYNSQVRNLNQMIKEFYQN